MLQRSPADYKVLGVGKVVSLQGVQVPSDHAPVFVVSSESCATGILVPGQVVLWPVAMLALYTPPGPTYIHTYIHKLYLSSDFSVAYIASISDPNLLIKSYNIII